MLETTSCPVCGAILQSHYLNSADFLLTREVFSLVKCDTCGVVYTNPRISAPTIGDYYAPDYTSYAAVRNNKFKRHLKSLAKAIYRDEHRKIACLLRNNNVKTVLEVGPGNGGLMKYLHEQGFEVAGVELDGACAERIEAMGVECYHGTIESVRDRLRAYDAVIMRQVLEHVYHPKTTLEIIRAVLSAHGLLYLTAPNIASCEARLFGKYWRGLDLPRHITHFAPETLANLLNRSGYSVDKIGNLAFPSSFIESLAFLTTKKGRFPNMLYYPLYYFWKLLSPLHVALMGSGVVEVVARKKNA